MILNKSVFAVFIASFFMAAPVMAQEESQADKNGTSESCTEDGSVCFKFE